MAAISLCMIAKDEEEVLARCLSSICQAVDEIIVVDTGSCDGTKAAAREFTDQVYDFLWQEDFSAARNFSFSKGHMEYLMWLDADDVVPGRERERLLELKGRLDTERPDVVMLPYDVAFDEAGNPTLSFYRERIIRRCAAARWRGRVHEAIQPFGRITRENIRIEHHKIKSPDPGRNLRIFEAMRRAGEPFGPRELYYYGKELYYHKQYHDAARQFERFLSGGGGGMAERLDACRHKADCLCRLGDRKRALEALYSAFLVSWPTPELYCDLGAWHFAAKQYAAAASWYWRAVSFAGPWPEGGFIQTDFYGYVPYLGLCACMMRLGRFGEAAFFNEMAEQRKPGSSTCAANRNYLAGIENGKGQN
jgi:glycosyltransferase involved in cell wall biosynthesis